jgi:hypothetical protein
MINGTWGLQMALFIASMFNYFINPNPEEDIPVNVAPGLYAT